MRIGITGGAGNVGTVLYKGLGSEHDILRFDRVAAADIRAIRFDDPAQVRGQFDGLQAVIHLAADPSPDADWESVRENNVEATYQVMEECRRAGVGRVVFASTNHVMHGNAVLTTPETLDPARKLSMKGEDPPNPDSLYAVSKLFGEHLGKLYNERFGIEFVAMRIGWITADNDPGAMRNTRSEDYMRAIWLSHRDCIQIFSLALTVPLDFFVAYATSDNTRNIFDLTETRQVLGYAPQDNSEAAFA
jgi:nucleoside-diphosphate-sugar epimerase